MKIWIVASSETELAQLKTDLNAGLGGTAERLPFYAGNLGNTQIYLGVTGVGVTAAALALGAFLTAAPADQAIMVGSSGAFPDSGLAVGEVAIATSETLAELGLCYGRGVGDAHALRLQGLDQTLSLDQQLADALVQSAQKRGCVRMGSFLSVVGVSDSEEQATARAARFQTIVENMEGYALALAGQRFGCRVGEVRGISNIAGLRDKSVWNFDLANMRAQVTVLNYLRRLL